LSGWFAINGEAIYGTRPWLVYGEGPLQVKGGAFKENFDFTARDIRFTTKGKTLYAIALGRPAGNELVIRSLAKTSDLNQNKISRVEWLGLKGGLEFRQTTNALIVELPAGNTNALTCSLKIEGDHLKPVVASAEVTAICPDAQGNLILSAEDAELHGDNLQLETRGGRPDIGYWNDAGDFVSWTARVAKAGRFNISAVVATSDSDAEFVVEVGDQTLDVQPPMTGGWDNFRKVDLGQIEIKQPGDLSVKVRAKSGTKWKPINLNSVCLTPVADAF
jgi:alpha-L-fucosidase